MSEKYSHCGKKQPDIVNLVKEKLKSKTPDLKTKCGIYSKNVLIYKHTVGIKRVLNSCRCDEVG